MFALVGQQIPDVGWCIRDRRKLDQFLAIQTGRISEKVFTAQEWKSTVELIDLQKPFDTVTKECSGTGYPTFRAPLHNWEQLLMHLKEISAATNQRWFREVATRIKLKLEEIMENNWGQDGVLQAALLDLFLKTAGILEDKHERAAEIFRRISKKYRGFPLASMHRISSEISSAKSLVRR